HALSFMLRPTTTPTLSPYTPLFRSVDEAPGGRSALQLIRENDYDLILLDLVMPDLNGLEVLDKLRDEGRLGLAPVVLVSASDKRSEEHTSELQSRENLVCRLLLEKK